jgi:hypothetical protein
MITANKENSVLFSQNKAQKGLRSVTVSTYRWTINFANSPACACRGSSGQKRQYGLTTFTIPSTFLTTMDNVFCGRGPQIFEKPLSNPKSAQNMNQLLSLSAARSLSTVAIIDAAAPTSMTCPRCECSEYRTVMEQPPSYGSLPPGTVK